jgi:hypothetical protein
VNASQPQPMRVGLLMERGPQNLIINSRGRNVTVGRALLPCSL